MGYFKKFTDFCAGFALFSALIFLLREFMSFVPRGQEEPPMGERLTLFFSKEPIRDYDFYLPLIALLLLSLTLSLLLKKAPYVSFGVSLLPLTYCMLLFTQDKLYERPMLYLVLLSLHSLGCFVACLLSDREDRGRRGAYAADLACLAVAGLGALTLRRSEKVLSLEWGEASLFDQTMYYPLLEDADLSVFRMVIPIFLVLILLRLLWRDLYFLDAALALPPAVYLIYLWCADGIPVHGALLVSLSVICALARLTVMLVCKPKSSVFRG